MSVCAREREKERGGERASEHTLKVYRHVERESADLSVIYETLLKMVSLTHTRARARTSTLAVL